MPPTDLRLEVIKMKVVNLLIGLCLVVIFISGCLPKAPISTQEAADMLYLKATNLQDSEEYDKATDEFEAFVGRYPNSNNADNAQLEIGNNYRIQEKYNDAISAYEMLLEKYPQNDVTDKALLGIGDSYLDLGERAKAIDTYQKLVDKYPYLNNEVAAEAQNRIDTLKEIEKCEEVIESGDNEIQDNAQYQIGNIYFSIFNDYDKAIREFNKVVKNYPQSELADDAMWMVGECYWAKAAYAPPRGETDEQQAFARVQYITDRYPQLAELDRYDTDGYPHWPAGKRGDRYEMYFAEVRRLLTKYPDLKSRSFQDFIPENYKIALDIWHSLILTYPNTDAASNAPKKISEKITELGKLYYANSMPHFASILLKESLQIWPSPEAHIYLAYYYADVHEYTGWTYYQARIFSHIKEAEKLVPPNSDLALDLKNLKSWMKYRTRLESLEAAYFNLKNRR
jgi:tol-pal system protein YbgF